MSKEVLITGATGLLGKEIVNGFLKAGIKVIATTRSSKNISKEWIDNPNLSVLELDFNSPNYLLAFRKGLKKINASPTDIIFNARNIQHLKIEDDGISAEENIIAEFNMAVTKPYTIIMDMIKTTNTIQNIVFVASIYGVVGPNKNLYDNLEKQSPIQYGVAKSAQIHLTKELAVRLACKKINVNCISFGGFEGRAPKQFVEKYNKLNLQNRMLKPQEAFGIVEFLVSEKAKGITGENIKYDSGWTIW